jgi:UDP-glucose:(heptosyl)LPS alpha-1,3-glucosyltransferase
MKIAIIVSRFDPQAGGLEQWTAALVHYLSAQGHELHIVTFAATITDIPARLHVLPDPGSFFARSRALAAGARAVQADVILDTGASWCGDVLLLPTGSHLMAHDRALAAQPWRQRMLATLNPKLQAQRALTTLFERYQLHRARHIIAISAMVRDVLVAIYPAAARRIHVIYNGVDTTRFAPAAIASLRDAARARWHCGDTTTFLLLAYNLHLKNLDTALAALAPLAAAGHAVRLLVAGGDPTPAWEDRIAVLGLAGKVQFCGAVADTVPLFAAADILLHPALWDACSLAVLEAMACGLPAITTATNGVAGLMTHGHDGFIAHNPRDADELAGLIRPLLNETHRQHIGQAARQTAMRHDSTANFAAVEQLLAIGARQTCPKPVPDDAAS